jgi:YVTN family beta-propeller protein
VVATVDVRAAPAGVAITPDGSFVYVANNFSDDVSVIRTSDNTVVATVDVGHEPALLAITPDGALVYVTNFGANTVSVIQTSDDPADDTVVATVDVGDFPTGVAITLDGSFVYVSNSRSHNVSVIRTSDNTVVATVDVGLFPEGVAASPDGSFVYVRDSIIDNSRNFRGHVSVIEIFDNSVFDTVTLKGSGPGFVAITPALTEVGNGNTGDGSCSLAPATASNASLPVYLIIPAFIVIFRLWRRTKQKHT